MDTPPPVRGDSYRTSPPRKKSKHKSLDAVINFPNLTTNFNIQENAKFIIMKSTNPDLPLNKINIFLLSKALNGLISENNRKFTKFTRDGNLLILTKTKRQAELLIKTKNYQLYVKYYVPITATSTP
ncbi:hypothetical protein FF38_06279 [Lucilia cuprina]|uniref:Uncharacterized protein n=1 Tax=Lucilia cuprina TaxID=7375 RepID=A0A0L0CFI4_LUCCU|nr:hypothetical protein FF38_06279 [Lucilia cuprina]